MPSGTSSKPGRPWHRRRAVSEPVAVLVNFGEEDAVYVIDAGRDDVQVFTKDGTYLRTIGRHGAQDRGI